MRATAQGYDLVMAFECNIMQGLCGAHWRPSEVWFSHGRPKDIRPYQQWFHSDLRFDADRTAMMFPKTWLDRALPGSDPRRHRALQCEIAARALLTPDDHAEQIRRALRAMVPSGLASEAMVSRLLAIPARTLRRYLAAQGTSFRELLEEVRYEIARQLLADTDLSTAEIAHVLHYADASAFTRAFRRWTNLPPAAWRS